MKTLATLACLMLVSIHAFGADYSAGPGFNTMAEKNTMKDIKESTMVRALIYEARKQGAICTSRMTKFKADPNGGNNVEAEITCQYKFTEDVGGATTLIRVKARSFGGQFLNPITVRVDEAG